MSAEDSRLGEHLGTVRAAVGLLAIVLSQMNLYVAALGKCLSTAVDEALEEPLLSICLRIVDLDGLAHLFRDGFVPFRSLLLSHVVIFVVAAILLDVIEADSIVQSDVSRSVTVLVASWGQNRCGGVSLVLTRKNS